MSEISRANRAHERFLDAAAERASVSPHPAAEGEPELLPCPFCGVGPYVHEPDFMGDHYQISCGCVLGEGEEDEGACWRDGKTFAEAAERWNRRDGQAAPDPLALLEALRQRPGVAWVGINATAEPGLSPFMVHVETDESRGTHDFAAAGYADTLLAALQDAIGQLDGAEVGRG